MTSSRKLGPALISTRDSEEERFACLGDVALHDLQEDDSVHGLDPIPAYVCGSGDTTQQTQVLQTEPTLSSSPLLDRAELSLDSALTSLDTQSETNTECKGTNASPGQQSASSQLSPAAISDLTELILTQLQQHQQQQQQTKQAFRRIVYPKSKRQASRDIFNPFKRNINRFNRTQASNSNNISSSSASSADQNTSATMKHDHRRDTSAAETAKNMSRHPLDFKRTYLFLYNLALFVMFLKVSIILMIKTLSGTMDDETVQGTAFIIKLLTYTQLMESVHPVLGLVPGSPAMPFLQSVGRLVVNLFLADPVIRQSSAPNAHLLFIVWSSIEIFRYSYYALRVFKVEVYPLTWCRYSLFLPLYPMGGYFESQVILTTIGHYEKTGAYSLALPNSANFSFNLPSFLRFYTFVLLGPSILYLMRYMLGQRAKQLKSKLD